MNNQTAQDKMLNKSPALKTEELAQTAVLSATPAPILPTHTVTALQTLIKITKSLIDLSERETKSLIQSDMVTFSILQDEKEKMTAQYAKASGEFRARLPEFRSADKALVARLQDLQTQLAEKANNNNMIVGQIRKRAEQNTQKTLLSAQELGQRKPVRFLQSSTRNMEQTA